MSPENTAANMIKTCFHRIYMLIESQGCLCAFYKEYLTVSEGSSLKHSSVTVNLHLHLEQSQINVHARLVSCPP
jgi:hypothetical protein